MKKIFAFALAAFSTVSMFAAIDSQLTIYLDTDSKEVEARIAAGDTYSPFDAGACATYMPMYSNPSNIGMYVQYQGGDFMELNAPELVNVPLVIVTSREAAANQNYELFAEVGASHTEAVYLTDLRPDGGGAPVTIELNDLTGYSFSLKDETAYVEGENSVIADRFVINYNPALFVASVTTNEDGWASFSWNADLVLAYPAGLTIYKGDFNDDLANPAIALNPVADIPAGAGVFVKGEANTTYYFAATTATADMSGNDIAGCVDATPVSNFAGHDIYTLRYANGETALWHYTGTDDIPAHKAVLPISLGGAPAPRRISFHFEETQAVENVQSDNVQCIKFIENGEVLIRRGEAVYNLQGQMVR